MSSTWIDYRTVPYRQYIWADGAMTERGNVTKDIILAMGFFWMYHNRFFFFFFFFFFLVPGLGSLGRGGNMQTPVGKWIFDGTGLCFRFVRCGIHSWIVNYLDRPNYFNLFTPTSTLHVRSFIEPFGFPSFPPCLLLTTSLCSSVRCCISIEPSKKFEKKKGGRTKKEKLQHDVRFIAVTPLIMIERGFSEII